MKNSNLKTYIIAFMIIILIAIAGGVVLQGKLPTRLSASINDLSSDGVKIYCDNNVIKVNEEMKCYAVGYLSSEITSVDATFSSSSNLMLYDITNTSNFKGSVDNNIISYYSVPQSKGKFDIATFKIKAKKMGNGTIQINNVKIGDSDFKKIEVNNYTYGIQIMQ